MTPHLSSSALLNVLIMPCTVWIPRSTTPLLWLLPTGLFSTTILPPPSAARSLPHSSTKLFTAGSLSLFTITSPCACPSSLIQAINRLAAQLPDDFLGTTVAMIAFVSRILPTSTANVLPPPSSPMNMKSMWNSGNPPPSPPPRLHASSLPLPRTQCRHQFLYGKCVISCSFLSCRLGVIGSNFFSTFLFPISSSSSPSESCPFTSNLSPSSVL